MLFHHQRQRRRAKVVARCGSTQTSHALPMGGCLVPLSWVCGWVLREVGSALFLLVAEVNPPSLDFPLPGGLDESISHHLPFAVHPIPTLRQPSPPPIPSILREPSPCPAWQLLIPSDSLDDPLALPHGVRMRTLESRDTEE